MFSLLVSRRDSLLDDLDLGDAGMRSRFGRRMLCRFYGLNFMHPPLSLLRYGSRRTNHRRSNGSRRWHEHSEQDQEPKADEFH